MDHPVGKGFTLVEVLIVAAVGAVALLTLIGVFLLGYRWSTESQSRLLAAQLARNGLEAVRATPFEDLPDTARTFDGSRSDPADGPFPPAPYPSLSLDGQEFTFVYVIEPLSDRARDVRVEVRPRGKQPVVLRTYVRP
ncbi:MAG: prepilin-type N-terminal cleavage/methylation domain-containing protein [Vulcanimicrobiota bacterium]